MEGYTAEQIGRQAGGTAEQVRSDTWTSGMCEWEGVVGSKMGGLFVESLDKAEKMNVRS